MADTWTGGALTVTRHTYARNVIIYTGGGSGTATLTRTVTYADGWVETATVAGAGDVPAGAADTWIDGEVPFGEKVTSIVYRLGAHEVAVPVEDRQYMVLSDPSIGLSVNLIGAEIGDRSWSSATTAQWLDVQVHGAPLVTIHPEQAHVQHIGVYTLTREARDRVDDLCKSRRPLLLRSAYPGVDDMWFVLVGDRTERRTHNKLAQREKRLHTWDAHVIPRPTLPGGHVGDTLGDLHATVPTTLGDIATQWSTLGDIAAAALVPERPLER